LLIALFVRRANTALVGESRPIAKQDIGATREILALIRSSQREIFVEACVLVVTIARLV
jgi:hypothetical protein